MLSPKDIINQDDCLDWFYKTSPRSTAYDNKKEVILPLPAPTMPCSGSKNGQRKKKTTKKILPWKLE